MVWKVSKNLCDIFVLYLWMVNIGEKIFIFINTVRNMNTFMYTFMMMGFFLVFQ